MAGRVDSDPVSKLQLKVGTGRQTRSRGVLKCWQTAKDRQDWVKVGLEVRGYEQGLDGGIIVCLGRVLIFVLAPVGSRPTHSLQN